MAEQGVWKKSASVVGGLADLLFGKPPTQELPRRVVQTISESQRSSEVLVCLLQFCAIAFFVVFYSLTPKGFDRQVPFEPVPWALAVYSMFTGFRLWLALRDRLGPVVLALSVVVDIAVLMITIWSFHLQYQQPPSIYLKAPTLLYVFILIALRTLRLEAVYVILAGVVAILGWGALVAYAGLLADDVTITHDFAVYVTSPAILLGAEVDKIVSIAVVTAVLSLTAVRARRLLIQSALQAHAANELSRFFAPEIAGEIRNAPDGMHAGEAHFTDAAVIVVDLRNFTQLTKRLEPTATVRLLIEYQERVVPALQRHGASIDKFLGDGVMATFGAARATGTHAADAFRAAEDLLVEIEKWNALREAAGDDRLALGLAITVDRLLFGVMGYASRLEYTVIGDAVNVAAKLEKHCKVLGVPALATASALVRAERQGYRPQAPPQTFRDQRVEGVGATLDLIGFGPRHLAEV